MTSLINLLDLTACSFPVNLTVDPILDPKPTSFLPFLSAEDKELAEMYTPELYKDAPIGLQVIGPRLHEEEVIGLVEVVVAALKAL